MRTSYEYSKSFPVIFIRFLDAHWESCIMETIIRKPTYTNDRYMKIDYNGGLRDS